MKKTCVEFENVNFSYRNNQVLEDISFSVEEGDYIGLVGGNGSGKTTMLRIMLGLLPAQTGNARLFGTDVKKFQDWGLIGYVPQHVARGESAFLTTVREVVESGLVSRKKYFFHTDDTDEKIVQWAMEVTETTAFQDRLISNLSGGERQLVFIARALVSRPKLLVLDEPTTGVDAQSQERFYRFISALNEKHSMTIILVSHDLEVVAREVKSVICVNRQLVCHVKSKEFIDGNYLQQLYGEDMKFIHHEHHHG